MANSLHQVNLTVSSEEDRLLLRLSTSKQHEYRLWLTRRFVRALWGVLVKAAERLPGIGEQSDESVRLALLSFQHDAAIKEADFKTAYQGTTFETPFGIDPVLLTGAKLKTQRSGAIELSLETFDKRTLSLRLDSKLLHSLCSVIAAAAAKADWDLDLKVGVPLSADRSSGPMMH
jgi:hypothetical protein